jgi:hypothetical protein
MSVIDTLTVQDFKTRFSRQFFYASIWSNTVTYNTNDIVYYYPTININIVIQNAFYQALNNGVTTTPTTNADWTFLNGSNYVLDSDITEAMSEAGSMASAIINTFANNKTAETAYLHLTAHYLVTDFANRGLASIGSNNVGNIAGKAVDDVSLNFQLPESLKNNLIYSGWSNTGYGQKALQLMLPKIVAGQYGIVFGATLP